jgi:hypothetical protein
VRTETLAIANAELEDRTVFVSEMKTQQSSVFVNLIDNDNDISILMDRNVDAEKRYRQGTPCQSKGVLLVVFGSEYGSSHSCHWDAKRCVSQQLFTFLTGCLQRTHVRPCRFFSVCARLVALCPPFYKDHDRCT